MIKLFKVLSVFVALSMVACTDSDDDLYSAEQGIYVLNSNSNTWDISFYQFLTSKVIGSYYTTMNPTEQNEGESAISFSKRRSQAYILTQRTDGSGAINIIDFKDFKSTKKISGFSSPQSLLFLSDSAGVVANGGALPSLSFCDFTKNQITATISLQYQPGKLLLKGKYLYVVHPQNNVVSVIDHITKLPVTEIPTLQNPSDLVIDSSNDIWIDCPGSGLTKVRHLSWQTELRKEDFLLNNSAAEVTCRFGLAPSNSYLYYFDNGLKRHYIGNNQLPDNKLISDEDPTLFGGFNIDSNSGNIYYLKRANATDTLLIYQSNGTLVRSMEVGSDAKQTLSYY